MDNTRKFTPLEVLHQKMSIKYWISNPKEIDFLINFMGRTQAFKHILNDIYRSEAKIIEDMENDREDLGRM